MWSVELLGGLSARQLQNGRGRTLTRFQSRQTGLLLAYLAYYRQRSLPREELIELLWPESELDRGRQSLSQALSSLRHQLEPPGVAAGVVLIADRHSIRLNPEAYTSDVAAFEAALQGTSRASSRTERRQRLEEAVALYRGELLPGYYEDWCLTQRGALREQYLQALHQLVQEAMEDGDFQTALTCAHRAVTADPLREEAHLDLMRLHAASGQPAAALRQYRELERLLREELGDAPSAAVREIAAGIERSGSGVQAGSTRSAPGAGPALRAPAPSDVQAGAPSVSAPTPNARRPTPNAQDPTALPSGTVTFLMTDIEGSTALWERTGEAYTQASASHHALLRHTFKRYGGVEVKEAGDGFLAAFESAGDAMASAVAGQQALTAHPWPEAVGALRVRMALHTGDVALREGEYHSLVLHHLARMLVAGHGGQVLCSELTAGLIRQGEIEPGVQLLDLGVYRLRDVPAPERLFQVNYPGMPRPEFPPLKAVSGYASHLPLQFTRFFGREAEIARLLRLLAPVAGPASRVTSRPASDLRPATHDPRLVTVTGIGGTGKTRLALEVAGQLSDACRGAVFFVPLAEVTEAASLVEAILDTMGLERIAGIEPLTRVVQEFARQPTLLLLDNFEQLVPGGVAVVQKLLEGAPGLTCLVTSRRTLNLAAEQEFPLGPLPTPTASVEYSVSSVKPSPLNTQHSTLNTRNLAPEALLECPSVQLFVDRAQRVRPDFALTRANAGAVAELCRRLEGMPLALELAAARAQVLTPSQLLQQLRRRLDVLVSRQQDVAERHRTLRAAIDWSYRLLTPALQQFFTGLSVFRGGWTLEAAETVSGEELALDLLMQLRECSLILAETGATEMRFRMLESLQEYAAQQLDASPERATSLHQQHAEHFHRFAAEQVDQLRTSGEVAGLQRLEADLENVRTAMDWSEREGRDELCAQIALALGTYLQRRGFQSEALQRIETGLSAARQSGAEHVPLYAGLLRERAGLHLDRFEWAEAHCWVTEARLLFEQWGDAQGIADANNLLGLAAKGEKRYAEARNCFETARQQFERTGDKVGIAKAHSNLGVLDFTDPAGDKEEAARHWRESLRLYRQCEDQRGIAEVLNNLGAVAQEQGELDEAWRHYDEALQIEQALRNAFGIGRALSNLGEVAELQGDLARACRLFGAAESIFGELGSPYQEYTANFLARTASQLGYSEAAVASLRDALEGSSEEERIRWALGDEENV